MQYHVQSGGRQEGPITSEAVLSGLRSGQFDATDLGWHEGLKEWQSLDRLFPNLNEAAAVPASGPPPPLPPPPPRKSYRMEDDPGQRLLLPIGRSGWAIAAGYLGLFAFLIVPAPLALVVSLIALRDLKKPNPDGSRKYGMGRAVFGLMIGAFGSAILLLLLLLRS